MTQSVRDVDEPSIAINPLDPRNAVLLVQDWAWADQPDAGNAGVGDSKGISAWVTRDAGETWASSGFMDLVAAVGSPAWAGDPAIAFNPSGRAVANFLAFGSKGGGLFATGSDDGGATWSPPVRVFDRDARIDGGCVGGADKNYITADPTSGAFYVAWTATIAKPCDGGPITQPTIISRSDDGGVTWVGPFQVNPREGKQDFSLGSLPRVALDGTVYVADVIGVSYNIESPCPPFRGLNAILSNQNPSDLRSSYIYVSTSKDQGVTWTSTRVSPVCEPILLSPEEFVAPQQAPGLAIDSNSGVAVLTWATRDARTTVYTSRSTDGGQTWSAPGALPKTTATAATTFPWVTAWQGTFWLQYIESHAGIYRPKLTHSTDGGVSWSPPIDLATRASCDCLPRANGLGVDKASPGSNTDGTPRFIGHYMGLAAEAGLLLPAWVDARDPGQPTAIWTKPIAVADLLAGSAAQP